MEMWLNERERERTTEFKSLPLASLQLKQTNENAKVYYPCSWTHTHADTYTNRHFPVQFSKLLHFTFFSFLDVIVKKKDGSFLLSRFKKHCIQNQIGERLGDCNWKTRERARGSLNRITNRHTDRESSVWLIVSLVVVPYVAGGSFHVCMHVPKSNRRPTPSFNFYFLVFSPLFWVLPLATIMPMINSIGKSNSMCVCEREWNNRESRRVAK